MGRKSKKRSRPAQSRQGLSGSEASITREVDYIIQRAQGQEGRIVTLGSLLLFSTETGDAWLLDPEDGYALCLARQGTRQAVRIMETDERFAIEWDQTYQIQDDLFITADRSGRTTAIAGYPTQEILSTFAQAKKARRPE